jgi:hypothetical protein
LHRGASVRPVRTHSYDIALEQTLTLPTTAV